MAIPGSAVVVSPDSQSAPVNVDTGWYTITVQGFGIDRPAPAGGWAFDLTESAGTANGTFSPGTTVTMLEGQSSVRFKYQAPTTGTRTLLVTAEGAPFATNTATAQAVITGAVMASSAATLAVFVPKDAVLFGQPASVTKYNGVDGVKMPKPNGANSPSPACVFAGVLPRPATTGFSSTTGIQVKIAWSAPHGQITGAARFAAAFDLKGQTDLPLMNTDGFPAYGTTNEVAGNSTVGATAGIINYVSLSVTIAKIQNGQSTAPAIGDYYRLRIRRVCDNAGDTISDEVYIHSVELLDY